MANQKKTDIVSELSDKVKRATVLVLTDYQKLTHKQLEDLHRKLKTVDAEYIVTKNSLLKIASRDSNFDLSKTDTALTGPTAVLIGFSDQIAPIKELFKFIKVTQLPTIKSGLMEGKFYNAPEVAAIAALPSKEVLQAQAVSRISSPMYGLLYTLNGNFQKLALVLSRIKKS